MSKAAQAEPIKLNQNEVEGSSNSITKNNKVDIKNDTEIKNITTQSKNNENKKSETPKKSNLKQMTLTEIAKNVSPKIKPPISESPPKESIEINNSNENKTDTNTNKSSKDNEAADNDNKLSFSKRNIIKILGCNYNSKKQLIFAVKLKKPDKTVYVSYFELKKRSPQVLCDYFESLISFV